jgi:predicted GNAT family acetyltransferase
LADHGDAVPGLNGEAQAVRAAVRRYQEHRPGATVTDTTGVRLHRLGDLVPPNVPGRARVSRWDDRELVQAWYRGFAVDVHHDPERVTEGMAMHLDRHTLLLWEVDGTPVSMAGRSPAAAGVARVGPVYTPPEHRRHGYGAAVTAEVSALAQGPDVQAVVLFTDLGNPTSNKIYREIGYRPVRDYLEVSLSSAADRLPR